MSCTHGYGAYVIESGWFVVAGVWPHTLGSVHSVHFSSSEKRPHTHYPANFACPSRLGIDVNEFVFDALDKGVIYVQRSAKVDAPGCVNAAAKLGQK